MSASLTNQQPTGAGSITQSHPNDLAPSSHMNIKEVRRTANDALLSKLSASIRGYFHDDFLQYYSFPIISEYVALQLPDFTAQRNRLLGGTGTGPVTAGDSTGVITTTKTTLPMPSPYSILDNPPTFQNTPYSPLPTSSSHPSVVPNPLLPQHRRDLSHPQMSPQFQANLDLTFPKPLISSHRPSACNTPQQSDQFSPYGNVPNRFQSQLPPSLLPPIPCSVPTNLLPRRSPLINKGYACRVHALDKIVVDFIKTCQESGQKSQILSIGAGYDTTYFRLKYHHNIKPTQYIELDFPHTIAHKANLIHHPSNSPLLHVINSYSPSQYEISDSSLAKNMYTTFLCPTDKNQQQPQQQQQLLEQQDQDQEPGTPSTPQQSALFTPTPTHSERAQQQTTPFTISYHDFSLVGCDGRDVASLQTCLNQTLWDPNIPTLMLFECVLVYIPPQAANDMLQTLSRMHNNINMVAVYEQMHPNDPFGRTMMQNLHERGCPLLSLPTYPDLQHQLQRFKNFGFQTFTGWSLSQIAQHFTPCPGVEVLDEMEEYHLMSSHYTVFMALKDPKLECQNGENDTHLALATPSILTDPAEAQTSLVTEEAPTSRDVAEEGVGNANSGAEKDQNTCATASVATGPSPARKPSRLALSQRSSMSSQSRRDPYDNLHSYARQHGANGPILTVPGTTNVKCSGDYDWCTSTLNPTPYQYEPKHNPAQIESMTNQEGKIEEVQNQEKDSAFDKIGFMGCFPPSYQPRSVAKRNGAQLIVD